MEAINQMVSDVSLSVAEKLIKMEDSKMAYCYHYQIN